jgi:hypothetical protein
MFGGNPGDKKFPHVRLGDMWRFAMVKLTAEDLLAGCRRQLRCQAVRELAKQVRALNTSAPGILQLLSLTLVAVAAAQDTKAALLYLRQQVGVGRGCCPVRREEVNSSRVGRRWHR